MRRKPTEAQKVAAEEKRAKFRALARQVVALTDEERRAICGECLRETLEIARVAGELANEVCGRERLDPSIEDIRDVLR